MKKSEKRIETRKIQIFYSCVQMTQNVFFNLFSSPELPGRLLERTIRLQNQKKKIQKKSDQNVEMAKSAAHSVTNVETASFEHRSVGKLNQNFSIPDFFHPRVQVNLGANTRVNIKSDALEARFDPALWIKNTPIQSVRDLAIRKELDQLRKSQNYLRKKFQIIFKFFF